MPALQLTTGGLVIVHRILQQSVPDGEVLAFACRVKKSTKPYSDLDLAIMTQ